MARWWDGLRFDIETAWYRGAFGVIDGWLTTITASEDDKNAPSITDRPIIRVLVPRQLEQRERLAATVAELDATIKAAENISEDEDDETDDLEPDAEVLSGADLRKLKSERTKAKKQLKLLDVRLLDEATRVRGGLTTEQAEEIVLNILRDDLKAAVDRAARTHRQQLVATYQRWHDKYAITLRQIETERDNAAALLDQFLTELGYE